MMDELLEFSPVDYTAESVVALSSVEDFFIDYDNAFTTKALYRMRIKWPIISESYLDHVFTALRTLGFFEFYGNFSIGR